MMNEPGKDREEDAELVLRCKDLGSNLDFFQRIGFRLESIFPADDPREAVISGYGLRVRLVRSNKGPYPGNVEIRITKETAMEHSAPCGAKVVFAGSPDNLAVPEPEVSLQVSFSDTDDVWVAGRAGMRYRDLIPRRLGGYLIASHIHIPEAGPVPDYVHYHNVLFQLIFCRKGWARLVYEDQGEPFVFEAGDCVLQPPGIRHRVLENSVNLEVIEISCPAEHITYADNDMELPNGLNPGRVFGGQSFLWSRASEANWLDMPEKGIKYRETGIGSAANGMADARVLRPAAGSEASFSTENNEITFYFILNGNCRLRSENEKAFDLNAGDALTVPEGMTYVLEECAEDSEILEIRVFKV